LRGISRAWFLFFIEKVSKNVIEDVVTIVLWGEVEGLDKFAMRFGPVGHGANNLNYDVVTGDLRVDVSDADLGVLKFELSNTLLNDL
jgi:hypothetical protein